MEREGLGRGGLGSGDLGDGRGKRGVGWVGCCVRVMGVCVRVMGVRGSRQEGGGGR